MANNSRRRVRVNQDGMAKVLIAINDAGKESSFLAHLKEHDASFVLETHDNNLYYSVNRKTFGAIKKYVINHPDLSGNKSVADLRNSDDDDNFVRLD